MSVVGLGEWQKKKKKEGKDTKTKLGEWQKKKKIKDKDKRQITVIKITVIHLHLLLIHIIYNSYFICRSWENQL